MEASTMNRKQSRESVFALCEWLEKQAHLPQRVDEKLMESMLFHCKGNVHRAKQKLDNYFSARTKLPRVFKDRDPTAHSIRFSAKEGLLFSHLPQYTDDGNLVFVCRVGPDPAHLGCWDLTKRLCMTFDKLLFFENPFSGVFIIFDFTDYTLQHFMTASLHLKTILTIVEKVYPFRVKSFHCVNSPNFVDTIVSFLKKCSSPKFRHRFVVHSKNLQSLYELVGRKILPRELGGEEKTLEELNALQQEELESLKNWFSEQENICSNEALRPAQFSPLISDLQGMDGTFSSLQID